MQLKVLESISVAGSQETVNQDYVCHFEQGVLVLDGASPLIPEKDYKTHTFVKDFSDCFIHLYGLSSQNLNNQSLRKLIQETLSHLSKQVPIISSDSAPSASGIIMCKNHNSNELELVQIGDCKGYLYNNSDNKVLSPIFAKTSIEYLDEIALNAQSAYIELGYSATEARALINALLVNHRSLMNSKKGYASLTLVSSCANLIRYKSIPLKPNNTYKLLLTTDGFYKGFEDYAPHTLKSILDQSISLKDALNCYRSIESIDDNLKTYPRFKVHDDASAILIEIHA